MTALHAPASDPPRDATAPVSVLHPAQARLGECPLWCERSGSLWWTDIDACTLWRHRVRDGQVVETAHWELPATVGSFALCEREDLLLLGLARGVALFDAAADEGRGRLGALHPLPAQPRDSRINDGRCDHEGRFVFGLYHPDESTASPFWRVGPDLQPQRLSLPEAVIANCLSFSPDGRTLYFADSTRQRILACDYPVDGQPGTPRVFTTLAGDDGAPDGAAVDAQGHLWVALWGAGALLRFAPDGREVARLPLRSSHPTCPVFGGPGLDHLYITSARKALAAHQRAAEPHAGDLQAWPSPVPGLPAPRLRTSLLP